MPVRDGATTTGQLSNMVASHLRALIISGELKPGTKIRAEPVAAELEVSPTPVREALQALRAEGFVTLVPRHGFAVAPLSGDDVRDLFRVQALLAGEMAARAASLATKEHIAEMLDIHARLTDAAQRNDAERLEHFNHLFHKHINQIAGSRKLRWAIGLMSRYVPREFYGSIDGWPETTAEDHQHIVDAISDGRADQARRLMEEHIMTAGELLAAHFSRRLAEDQPNKTA